MAGLFLLGFLLKREYDVYNSLGISALCILILNPRQLFDVGFQLSFLSVLSIVYIYPKLKSLLRLDSLKIKYIRFFTHGLLVSFSAWLGTMGLVAYYFKIFSPVTVLANLFIVPLATFITLCGFTIILAGLLNPPIASLYAKTCELAAWFLISINTFLVKLPYAVFNLGF